MKLTRTKYMILFDDDRMLSNNGVKNIKVSPTSMPKLFNSTHFAIKYMQRYKHIKYKNYQIKKVIVNIEGDDYDES